MPRRKFRYQMIQPEHINSIKVGNHYEVICEESYWDLEVGPVEWNEVDTPLEIPIDEIDSFIEELNLTSVNNIVEDFIEVSRELLSARMLSRDAGYHSVVWDANSYASGVYFVKMVAGEFVNTQKLMLIK